MEGGWTKMKYKKILVEKINITNEYLNHLEGKFIQYIPDSERYGYIILEIEEDKKGFVLEDGESITSGTNSNEQR